MTLQGKSLAIVAVLFFGLIGYGVWRERRLVSTFEAQTRAVTALQLKIETLTSTVATLQRTTQESFASLEQNRVATHDTEETTVIKKPNGTVIRKTKKDLASTQESSKQVADEKKTDETASVKTDVKETKDLNQKTEADTKVKAKVEEAAPETRPRWLATFGVGVSVPGLLFGKNPGPQLVPTVSDKVEAQLSLNRRLFGPVYGGVYGSTRGAVGLQLSLVGGP